MLFIDASYWSRKAETGLCEQTVFKIASWRSQPYVPGWLGVKSPWATHRFCPVLSKRQRSCFPSLQKVSASHMRNLEQIITLLSYLSVHFSNLLNSCCLWLARKWVCRCFSRLIQMRIDEYIKYGLGNLILYVLVYDTPSFDVFLYSLNHSFCTIGSAFSCELQKTRFMKALTKPSECSVANLSFSLSVITSSSIFMFLALKDV